MIIESDSALYKDYTIIVEQLHNGVLSLSGIPYFGETVRMSFQNYTKMEALLRFIEIIEDRK